MASMKKPVKRARKLPTPHGSQTVVPNPDMTDVRQALSRIESAVTVVAYGREERLARAVAVLTDLVLAKRWDALTYVVFGHVVNGDRAAIVALVPALHGTALDAAAFVLAGMKREQLEGKLDADDWFRTRLQRVLSIEVLSAR